MLTIVVKKLVKLFLSKSFVFFFCVFQQQSKSLYLWLLFTTPLSTLLLLLSTTTYLSILWYAKNNAVMIRHWFHEKFLLELQLYDVVLCTSASAESFGRRIQELKRQVTKNFKICREGFRMTKDDQKNSRKKTNNPFVWHTANRKGKKK